MIDSTVFIPEWIVVGVARGDQVTVLASSRLNIAELRVVADDLVAMELLAPVRRILRYYELTVQMRDVVVVHGDTYADAMTKLWATWHPDQSKEPAEMVAKTHELPYPPAIDSPHGR